MSYFGIIKDIDRYSLIKSTGINVEGKRERRREVENAAQELIASFIEKKMSTEIINKPFIQFLLNFWTNDSDYIRGKRLVDKSPLSIHYIESNHKNIEKHIIPFSEFNGITVGELTKT